MKSYQALETIFERLHRIGGISGIMGWDSAVMMPEKSASERAEQLAFLHSLYHDTLATKKVGEKIQEAKQQARDLSDWQKANLRLMEHSWLHATAVDEKLVVALSKAGSECEMAWRKARAENDFKTFAKHMKQVLKLVREKAVVLAEKLNLSKYDALLDQYDAGRKSAEIDAIFLDLKKFLPGFLDKVLVRQKTKKITPISGKFPIDMQKQLGEKMMKKIGFDFARGRLDTSHHPFCGGGPGDVRITTRYYENNFLPSFMGVLHETGHAMYEFGLPEKWRAQPVGSALGMSVHESQSLFVEMQIARSREFSEFAAPIISKEFGRKFSPDNLYNTVTRVKPGLIRVEADEVTYPAHVILRYEIEKDLIYGRMEIDDLPDVWNKKMLGLLGVKIPNDKNGCMQDIHWTDGSFGYFPTYTLGAMTAAQLAVAMKKQQPKIMSEIRRGDFKNMRKWLGENVHSHGSRFTEEELLKKATGSGLSAKAFKEHLQDRYLA